MSYREHCGLCIYAFSSQIINHIPVIQAVRFTIETESLILRKITRHKGKPQLAKKCFLVYLAASKLNSVKPQLIKNIPLGLPDSKKAKYQ